MFPCSPGGEKRGEVRHQFAATSQHLITMAIRLFYEIRPDCRKPKNAGTDDKGKRALSRRNGTTKCRKKIRKSPHAVCSLGAFSVAAKDAKQLSLPAGFRSSGIPEKLPLAPVESGIQQ
ncbi:hypothetical protein UZ35_14350 [Heyndrickxia coagulans]|nr:hypothetical protein CIW84_11530 [Heyndrickxia coagulans]KGB31113.1 hypothetical protein IE89_00770 [Heyndrickxia coagulans]KXT19580.1 hypothetical protein UZ35_14350 [Heyndrickxia coagulans]OZV93890.1 hypothetical protein CAY57_13785 [Heyndrickxia coagulans]